jgi:serine phosphatase RsbU (regulator of sigma subunit)
MLNDLRELLAGIEHVEDVADRALPLLRADERDLPHVDVLEPGADRPADGLLRFPLGATLQPTSRPVLEIAPSPHLPFDRPYREFVELIASTLGQAIDRIRAGEAEQRMSETLQRSLLTRPAQPEGVEIAVRYLPAGGEAQVGGDWYDAFVGPDGRLRLVVGDVAGHDRHAAAVMAQVRNVLRGVAYATGASPAGVLAALDEAMQGLGVATYATAVLAQVEGEPGGERTLRWCNAGHPPPILVEPDGRARLLESEPELLLGAGTGARADHGTALAPGATVVLYTDGLVERRWSGLDRGMRWLADVLAGRHDLPPEALCDHVLGQLDGVEDDVALMVMRTRRPRA